MIFLERSNHGYRNAALFGLAYLGSVCGAEFVFFVLMLHIYHLNHSAVNISIFTVLTFLPKFGAPFLGIVTDRFRKDHLWGWISLSTALLIFWLARVHDLVAIYGIWFIVSIGSAFSANIRAALMTEIIPSHNYARGNAAMLMLANAAKILAPLGGGLAAAAVRPPILLESAAGIYLLTAACCGLIKRNAASDRKIRREIPAASSFPHLRRISRATAGSRDILRQLQEGLQYLFQDRTLTYLVATGFCWRLFLGLQTSLFIVYVQAIPGRGDADYGLFLTLVGCGSILGSLLGPWLRSKASQATPKFNPEGAPQSAPNGKPAWMTAGLIIHFGTFALLGLIRNFYLAAAMMFLGFTAFYASLVMLHTLRDHGTQPELRGKVYGSVTAMLTLPAVLSMLAGGFLAKLLGAGRVFLGAGLAALLGLWLIEWLLNPWRHRGNKENAADHTAGAVTHARTPENR